MSKAAGVLTLIIVGIIVADALKNPRGVTAAGNSIVNFQRTAGNQLLGQPASK